MVERRKGWLDGLLDRAIRWRLGGYRQRFDPDGSIGVERVQEEVRVAVVGGGLAGITAAATLGERGFSVDLVEHDDHLGGKLGAWKATTSDGSKRPIEHGFHAFFRHYYNLNRFLEKTGARRHLVPIADYEVLSLDGVAHSYAPVATTPVLNLLSLARHGFYNLWEVARSPGSAHMRAMLEYDEPTTFARYDETSFAEFARMARIPDKLMLSFTTFARAFFASPERLSAAELLKSFHFYYLSHDGGLIYDHPDDDHATTLLAPFEAYLRRHGVGIHLGTPVEGLVRAGDRFVVHGETYDAVVLAADAGGVRAIAENSGWIATAAPRLGADLDALRTAQGYAVLRLWLDADLPWEHVSYVVTERAGALDAIALLHRIERTSREWFEDTGEAVLELHCYAVPEALDTEEAVRDALLEGLYHYVPAARERRIVREHLLHERDFPAFHVGMHQRRPRVRTSIDGLYLAGDWVRLPFPAMLMEAACSAGLLAANDLARCHGVAQEPVWHVPLRGVLAPRRRALSSGRDS